MFGATNKPSQATASSSGAAPRAPAEEMSPAVPTTLLRPRTGTGDAGGDAIPSGIIAGGIQRRPAGSGAVGNAPVSSGIVGYAPAPGSPNRGASGQTDASTSVAGGEASTRLDTGAAVLSPQDHGWLAQLDDLRKHAEALGSRGTPEAVARIQRAAWDLIDKLGVRRGEPGAEEKRALIVKQGNIPHNTLKLLDSFAISRAELAMAERRRNGLKDTQATGQFVGDMQGIEGGWSTMAPSDRADSIGHRINARLRDIGVPEIKIKTAPLTSETAGQFERWNWSIALNEQVLHAPQISSSEFGELLNTVYHEARHAEQSFLIARMLIRRGGSPAETAQKTRIPLPVCEAAARTPPLSRAQTEAASVWFDSMLGPGAIRTTRVYAAFDRTALMLSAAQQAHRASEMDPHRSQEEKQQTAREVHRLAEQLAQLHRAYEAAPEEKDAIAVGNAAGRIYATMYGAERAPAATPASGPDGAEASPSRGSLPEVQSGTDTAAAVPTDRQDQGPPAHDRGYAALQALLESAWKTFLRLGSWTADR